MLKIGVHMKRPTKKKLRKVGRNILIFSDGTGQAGGISVDENRSNIYKLYKATRVGPDSSINPAEQIAYYDAGLGSRPPSGGSFKTLYRMAHNFVSQATGFGLTTNIIDCYEMIIRHWRPGDRIFLFGFSRGAYTVRCLGGVLANCGVPTRWNKDQPMRFDSASIRKIAKYAVRNVYQHTASVERTKATPRQNELLDQRAELAKQFREKHGVDLENEKSNYPFFIGVFDTVAAVASKGSLLVLVAAALAISAAISGALWAFYPSYTPWFGDYFGKILSWLFGLIGFSTSRWWHWFFFVALALIGSGAIWYVSQAVKYAPKANPQKWWRTFTVSLGRMRFEDKGLNDNVKYARHAIAIDENRASFNRVGWGDPKSTRPKLDQDGVETFEQIWFAGNHSDIGGSYPESESRLSDIALKWIVESASTIKNGIKLDRSVLKLYPMDDGILHDQRRVGFPFLTKWFGLTWKGKIRSIPNAKTTLHRSVYERTARPSVLQYDVMLPYRPETLRKHERLTDLYKNIKEPIPPTGLRGWLASYF
jgi:uncharacterized protein (DUF2235 family)